jgi:ATP-binding cassette, subfamily G (WHITE), member 2, SNQ2
LWGYAAFQGTWMVAMDVPAIPLHASFLYSFRSMVFNNSLFSYLIEGLLGQAIGGQQITCSAVELVKITPPPGQTCAQYLNPYISYAGGYLIAPNATSSCEFCSFRTTDEFLGLSFNIYYSHDWSRAGIFIAFVIVNASLVFNLTFTTLTVV